MQKIYKYPMQIAEVSTVMMPIDAKILCIQVQDNVPTIWAIVDIENPVEKRFFFMFGTGFQIKEEDYDYVATIQLLNGKLVYHIFE